jgi:hypothetical protein
MPTFLTTSKMDPALVERIEASLASRTAMRGASRTGKSSPFGASAARRARTRRLVSIARFGLVLTAIFAVYTVVVGRREAKLALERSRTTLLDSVQSHGGSLGPDAHATLPRVESWLLRIPHEDAADLVAEELRVPGAFTTMLARPMIYVRGGADAFGSPTQIAAAASTSAKDALALCLLEPPEARTEKVLLDKVRVAYSGGWNLENRTANVRRLSDLVVGMPFLEPAWSNKVRAATEVEEVARLRSELERAPIDRAKQAAQSELLLAAVDEAGDGKGPTELDGERIHPLRVVLVDLRAGKVLLRARHVVDPSWITTQRRATYAIGLDSCAFALDVHEDVRKVSGKR